MSQNINTANHAIHAISAISWFTPTQHGSLCTASSALLNSSQSITQDTALKNWCKPSPDLNAPDQPASLLGQSVRYFQRMPAEARYALCAAGLAIHAADLNPVATTIGLLAGRFDGTLAANIAYFQDYLEAGRSLARGNMFVYTLPTSVLGSVSVVLNLRGPAFYLDHEQLPLQSLITHASYLISTRESQAMLILWSDASAAVCIAVGAMPDHARDQRTHQMLMDLFNHDNDDAGNPPSPSALAHRLQQQVTHS